MTPSRRKQGGHDDRNPAVQQATAVTMMCYPLDRAQEEGLMRNVIGLIAIGSTLATISAGVCQAPIANRFPENPLVSVTTSKSLGDNVNGPSVLRVPPWINQPLGRYYMYFAHHKGAHIRLAYANLLRDHGRYTSPAFSMCATRSFTDRSPILPIVPTRFTHTWPRPKYSSMIPTNNS